jgi:hypothetical protein
MKLRLFIILTTVLTLNAWGGSKRPMSVKKALRVDLWYNGITEEPKNKISNHKKRIAIPARQKHLWQCLERFEQKV